MPVLAKGDQGALTGVCQNGVDGRDSVDDRNTNRGTVWRQLVAFPGRHLQCFRTSEIDTRQIQAHWLHRSNLLPGTPRAGAGEASDGRDHER